MSEKYPYPECTQEGTTEDFCSEKNCKHLVSYDNWQTSHCDLAVLYLERKCPPYDPIDG